MRIILILALIPLVLVIVLGLTLISNPEIEYQIGQAFIKGEGGIVKNQDWGMFWMKRAADNGQQDALSMLARDYLVGLPEQNLEEAVKYMTIGEKKNNNECLKLLAYAYAYGQGVPQDYSRSIEMSRRSIEIEKDGRELMNLSFLNLILAEPIGSYKKAREYALELSKLGYTSAWSYWCLGLVHEYGLETEKDLKKSIQYYGRGAALGDNDCQYALARMWLEKKLTPATTGNADQANPNLTSALLRKYLDSASDTQVLDAQLLQAVVLATEVRDEAKERAYRNVLDKLDLRGFNVYTKHLRDASPPGKPNNVPQAIKLLRDENNDSDGSKLLVAAMLKRFGIGGTPDLEGFKSTLEKACDKHLHDAETIYANVLTGMDLGNPDYGKACSLYRQAAEHGQVYAEGQYGMLYALGLGVEHDWPHAISWLEKSAEAGDPESQFMLAGFYCDGRGVKPDRKRCLEFFEKAATQGHEDAALELGIISGSNDFPDVPQNSDTSERWLRKAIGYGFQEANYYLASMCLAKGRQRAAIECYKEAAEKGHLLSQIQLGRYYLSQDNIDLARKWFEAALKQGSLTAPRELQLLAIRDSMLSNNRTAKQLVVAKRRIDKGSVITKDMLTTSPNSINDDDAEWRNDVITDLEPIVGTTAEQDIADGSYITATDIDVPNPLSKSKSASN